MVRKTGSSCRPANEAGWQGVSHAGPCGTVAKRAAALAVSRAGVKRQRASLAVVCLYDGQMTQTGAREGDGHEDAQKASQASRQCC